MDGRFAVAVHIPTRLEKRGGSLVSSERMAGSINTNASLVRRLLGTLAASGLTTSQMGTGGGAFLARPAAPITLGDVYRAVKAGELFGLTPQEASNKAVVLAFYEAAINQKDVDAALAFIGPKYVQHNPRAQDGIEGLKGRSRNRARRAQPSWTSFVWRTARSSSTGT